MTRTDPPVERPALDRLHAVALPRRAPAPVLAEEPDRGPDDDAPAGPRARHRTAPGSPPDASAAAWPPAGGVPWLPVRPVRGPRAREGTAAARDAHPDPEPPAAPVVRPDLEPPAAPGVRPDLDLPAAPGVRPEPDVPAAPGVRPDLAAPAAPDARPDLDVRDVARRSRDEALAAAAAGYTQAYGHPLDHAREHRSGRRREPAGDAAAAGPWRWWLSTRHAVVAGVAVIVLGTGVAVRAATDVPDAPVAISSTEAVAGSGAPDGARPGDGTGTAASGDGGPDGVATGGAAGGAAAGGATPGPASSGPAGTGPTGSSAADPARASAGSVVVHVVGQVPAPGVLTLPTGSRVGDAVAAAGGAAPSADLTALNLARVVVDGEQIHVPAHGEAPRTGPAITPAGPGGGAAGGAGGAGPVELNVADLAALDALPGIGPVLAQRILDWRTENGPFHTVEELGEVSGIGDALLSRLRPLVRV